LNTEVVQGVVDGLFTVTAVGGHRPRCPPGPSLHTFDRRPQPGRVGGVAGLDVVNNVG
jgi:hypothetical protein